MRLDCRLSRNQAMLKKYFSFVECDGNDHGNQRKKYVSLLDRTYKISDPS